jgi:hypothetical protein
VSPICCRHAADGIGYPRCFRNCASWPLTWARAPIDPRATAADLLRRPLDALPRRVRAGRVAVRADAGYFAGQPAREPPRDALTTGPTAPPRNLEPANPARHPGHQACPAPGKAPSKIRNNPEDQLRALLADSSHTPIGGPDQGYDYNGQFNHGI